MTPRQDLTKNVNVVFLKQQPKNSDSTVSYHAQHRPWTDTSRNTVCGNITTYAGHVLKITRTMSTKENLFDSTVLQHRTHTNYSCVYVRVGGCVVGLCLVYIHASFVTVNRQKIIKPISENFKWALNTRKIVSSIKPGLQCISVYTYL